MRPYYERGNVFRMASFRLATLGTMFTTIGAVIVYSLIYLATYQAAQFAFTPIVDRERADLIADAAHDKLPLSDEVRRAGRESRYSFYALADRQGRFIAGNITVPADPLGWQKVSRWSGAQLPAAVQEVDGVGVALGNGDVLFLGEDATAFANLNTHIAYLFAGVFSFTVILGMLSSMLIAYYSLRRVEAISDTSRQILAGDLSRRIKLYGIDDELDFLTTDLNEMLAAIEILVVNARQVTSNIAHDLRSPLTRLRAHLEASRKFVANSAWPDPKIIGFFTGGLQQLDEIIGIFAALLRIAEIEAGAIRGNFTAINLSELCKSLIESYELVAEDRDQTLTATIEDGILIQGDRELITQMVVNVLENAIRHCKSGVTMNLSASMANHFVTIIMADHGKGIAEAERENVFKPFVRLNQARDTAGNGLGLSLVSAVVSLHNGAVSLHDNEPGLIVQITFPAIIH